MCYEYPPYESLRTVSKSAKGMLVAKVDYVDFMGSFGREGVFNLVIFLELIVLLWENNRRGTFINS
jgi:hypothetical protein